MPVSMPVVVDERCLLHDPRSEIWIGVATAAAETAERVTAIREALSGARLVAAHEHPDGAILAVHEPALVDYLRSAWAEWEAAGLPADPGQARVVPYVFAHAALTSRPSVPTATWAKPGYFAYDTMTLVGPGTWEAARGAVDATLTAVDLVLDGEPVAYACVRPPGHHVTRGAHGGSCYLNNAAVAAAALADAVGIVAVLDIDAHHGNGTQEIFFDRPDVVVGSVHVDPAAGWFPHFLGFADEVGDGSNRNVPLAPGSDDDLWLASLHDLVSWAEERRPRALVVALGVDAAEGDPESPLNVTHDGFREAGRRLAQLEVPTVFVQEGGYDIATIGALVRAVLEGFEA